MSKRLLLLHGPNLNLLGQRDASMYGSMTLAELEASALRSSNRSSPRPSTPVQLEARPGTPPNLRVFTNKRVSSALK